MRRAAGGRQRQISAASVRLFVDSFGARPA
jgi:hypothetical protein